MKLMITAHHFYPVVGGVENYIYNIGKSLSENYDIDIVILCSQFENKKFSEEITDNFRIYRLPYSFKISSTPFSFSWNSSISKIFKNELPDIVNGHIPVPGITDISARIAFKQKIPFLLTYHNDIMGNNFVIQLLSSLYYTTFGYTTLQLADKIIATSDSYCKSSPYLKNYSGKVEIIPPGVDLTRYTIKDTNFLRPKFGLADSKIILFVGQLNKASHHKGLKYLFEAFKIIQSKMNVILLVVGSGDYISHYKKMTELMKISDKVIFTGYVPNEDLPMYYNESDVFVLPSYSRQEGFGMVLIEAQACGTPLVGSNIGGIPSIIHDGITGLLVPIKNSEKLAEAIAKILSDDELRTKLINSGYQNVRDNYTWQKSTQKYFQTINDVLNDRKENL
jgi:glycosyltransferase involved in cell wall biosynthesis